MIMNLPDYEPHDICDTCLMRKLCVAVNLPYCREEDYVKNNDKRGNYLNEK